MLVLNMSAQKEKNGILKGKLTIYRGRRAVGLRPKQRRGCVLLVEPLQRLAAHLALALPLLIRIASLHDCTSGYPESARTSTSLQGCERTTEENSEPIQGNSPINRALKLAHALTHHTLHM